MEVSKDVLTIREVAKWLGVSERSVWGWSHDGKFPPPVALGRLRRWRRYDVEQWLARQAGVTEGGAK